MAVFIRYTDEANLRRRPGDVLRALTIIAREVAFPPTAKDGEVFAWEY